MEWIGGIALLAAGVGIYLFNRLVADRNRVDQAWSDVDVQLKRRHDLLPKLVEAVNAYAGYEQATLQQVTELRVAAINASGPAQAALAEGQLGNAMQRLIAIKEDYPDLKANEQFLDLQNEISDAENQIQYARRFYNGAVRNLNVNIESFPNLIVARLFGFGQREFFGEGD